MLMTVLKGEIAVKQSKTLIRLFKNMKDYLIENNSLLTQKDYLNLFKLINYNSDRITTITKIEEQYIYKELVKDILNNENLVL